MSFTRASMPSRLFFRGLLAIEVFSKGDVVGTADEDRHPLMILGRCDVQDSLGSRARLPARLLGEHAHGRDLVEEPELGLGLGGVAHIGGVHEDAAIEERDPAKPKPKLRLLYEVAPMSMLAEQAG